MGWVGWSGLEAHIQFLMSCEILLTTCDFSFLVVRVGRKVQWGRMETIKKYSYLWEVGKGTRSEMTLSPWRLVHQQEVKLTSFHKDTNFQTWIYF
jgi:hypothetical protein